MSESATAETWERTRSSPTPPRIIAGTVVTGNIDPRTMHAALELLTRRPERIVIVDTVDTTTLATHEDREEDLWSQFVHRTLVDSGIGLTYLNELRRRR